MRDKLQLSPVLISFCLGFWLTACAGGPGGTGSGETILLVSDRGGAIRIYERDPESRTARLVGSPGAADRTYGDSMPAPLPGGGVVFVSDREGSRQIYTIAPGWRDARRLTALVDDRSLRPDHSDPAPLGADRIVFARTEPGAGPGSPRDLFLMKTDGSGLRRLTRDPADDGSPASSPDGRAVVFISTRSGTPRLFLLPDTDATDPEDGIIELSSAAPPSPLFVPPGVPFVDGTPAFLSPRSIVFSRAPEGGPPQLFILGLGSARMALRQVTNARVTRFGASEPVLLGGETIVFTAGPGPPSEGATGPDRFAVYRIEAGGFNLSRITGREVQYSDFSRRLGNQ